jgi:hypothetical protein
MQQMHNILLARLQVAAIGLAVSCITATGPETEMQHVLATADN